MRISTKGRYGLKAMIDIAAREPETCTSLKDIATSAGIPESYLEQLFSLLKRAGLVVSVRGAAGGYVLSKTPEAITVGEVLRATEGSLVPVGCVDNSKEMSCGDSDCTNCVTRPIWDKIYENFNNIVDNISLLDLANDYKVVGGICE